MLEPLAGRLRASADYGDLASCDAIVICVPTPLTSSREPDLTYLHAAAARSVGEVVQAGAAGGAGVDQLSGHDQGAAAAGARALRARRRRGLPPRLLAGADRPRPHRLHPAHHAEAGRRPDRGLHRARPRALRADLRRGRRALDPRGGGAREAARERLPLGQHRLRQRARPALRPARDRRLGGDRRGRDQAVRVHALRSRPGDGRALPAGRPLLPRLQGARTRVLPGVHRAGRQGQPGAAGLLRGADRARPQRGGQAGARLARSCSSASATRPGSATRASRRR